MPELPPAVFLNVWNSRRLEWLVSFVWHFGNHQDDFAAGSYSQITMLFGVSRSGWYVLAVGWRLSLTHPQYLTTKKQVHQQVRKQASKIVELVVL